MNDFVPLSKSEIVGDRAFTHPRLSLDDLAIMRAMLDRLRVMAQFDSGFSLPDASAELRLEDGDGSVHRIVLVDWGGATHLDLFTVVGFFGQARDDVDHAPIMKIENDLLEQMANFPGLLVYYNVRLPDGRYGNLVLCTSAEVKESWRENPTHQLAVELSPRHYRSVRLHNGLARGGSRSGSKLNLVRTKYYDFRGAAPWKALREYA